MRFFTGTDDGCGAHGQFGEERGAGEHPRVTPVASAVHLDVSLSSPLTGTMNGLCCVA
jgi:hypothetical protein